MIAGDIGGEEPLRLVGAGVLAAAGLVFVLAGAVGVLRGAEVFARLHALRVMAFGAPLVLAGTAVELWDSGASLRLALLAVIIGFTGPALAHLIANFAHRTGVEPEVRR